MNTHSKRSTVILATREQLRSPPYYRRLWMAVRNMPISRRAWLDELANTFRDFRGCIVDELGCPYEVPMLDEVFGDDPDMRWLSYYLRADQSGRNPYSGSRSIERLQLLDLYFKIKHPKIAKHIMA